MGAGGTQEPEEAPSPSEPCSWGPVPWGLATSLCGKAQPVGMFQITVCPGHTAPSHRRGRGGQELRCTSWSWDFHVGDSVQHRLRRGSGALAEPCTERFAEDGVYARIRDGEQMEMARWRASSQIPSRTSSALHQPSGVTPMVSLTAATLTSDFLLGPATPSTPSRRRKVEQKRGIKVFSESQLHVLLLGCSNAPGCHHRSPPLIPQEG